ncbi:hypothetical protein LPB86_17610 [Pedobacter sp. MC2016-14]|uniref:hypothetical protein n=1 Tax=Pedobacter sp. MC2016-14 TaxID=2897327 RepID=UPI001E4AD4E1|nr:hypothetical protein [Pedobacter sp. MC2016-14]MCD0490062.1 hypothetical protein [Pedobacter sp. MC2016-14]
MISIKNVQPLNPEALFDLLKKEFSDYLNTALDANLNVEYTHVYDVVNISFPEITTGNAFSLVISDEAIEVNNHVTDANYNTELLEERLIDFLTLKAG